FILEASPPTAAASLRGLAFGLPALACFFLSRRPLRFALGLGTLLAAGACYEGDVGHALQTERSFFGVHRVSLDATGRYHLLVHGKTLHGIQSLDSARARESPP